MGAVHFKVDLFVENPDMMPELQARAADLRPAFEEIVKRWARNNQEKFAASVGMEESGADVDPSVFWEPLAASTIKGKRRAGFEDQIMVRTGDLELALEDTDRFFHEEMPTEAAFGTPLSLEDEIKVRYNFEKRPTIFLGLSDQKAIEGVLSSYFSLGEDFKGVVFSRGLANIKNRQASAAMDIAFNETVGSQP